MEKGTDIYIISGKHKSFRVGAFTITADSVPDFDNWGWDDYWDCSDWMRWHQLMKAAYGLDHANRQFIDYWSDQDAFMEPFNWCKYHSDFADYFEAQGINMGWLFSNLVVATEEVGEDAIDVVENVSSGASGVSTVIKYAAPVAAIIGGAWAIDKWVYPIFGKRKTA